MPAKPSPPANPELPEPVAADGAAPAETAEAQAAVAPDTSGWYRNRGPVELLVQPVGYPSALLKPGGATWLPADPQHPDLEPCDAPPPVPADANTKE